ncbi:MAG: hypothetical protein HQK57_04985 [Deltaproteobacteria bacterium]|nr:hypothetical protein [Deltaproteobacteria bacterium]MBF0524591.1 hypothetical protein [Deltaproteobacteria bacterium]
MIPEKCAGCGATLPDSAGAVEAVCKHCGRVNLSGPEDSSDRDVKLRSEGESRPEPAGPDRCPYCGRVLLSRQAFRCQWCGRLLPQDNVGVARQKQRESRAAEQIAHKKWLAKRSEDKKKKSKKKFWGFTNDGD